MAYDNTLTRPEDEEEAPNQGLPPLASVSGGTGGGGFASPGQKKGGGGTGFVNFDRYFNTNATAAEQMGTQAASKIEQDVTRGQAELARGYDQFVRQVHANTPSGNVPLSYQPGVGWTAGQSQYTGPSGFDQTDQFQTLKARFEGIQDNVRHGGTAERLQGGYAKDIGLSQQGQANYTHGMSAFDGNLAARGGRDQFAALNARYGNIGDLPDAYKSRGQAIVEQAQLAVAARNAAAQEEARRRNEEDLRRAEEEAAKIRAQIAAENDDQGIRDTTPYEETEEYRRRQEEDERRRKYDERAQ